MTGRYNLRGESVEAAVDLPYSPQMHRAFGRLIVSPSRLGFALTPRKQMIGTISNRQEKGVFVTFPSPLTENFLC
jgi:hypothetical protein